jgi:predicted kinase
MQHLDEKAAALIGLHYEPKMLKVVRAYDEARRDADTDLMEQCIDELADIAGIPLEEGLYDPYILKAVFMAGGPGSGKGFYGGKLFSGMGVKIVNSDNQFERFMKQAGLSLKKDVGSDQAQALRPRAKAVTKSKMRSLSDNRIGLVIDGTAKDPIKVLKQKKQLESLGYDTAMVLVNTSLETAKERNQQRERTVPDEIVQKGWQQVQDARRVYKQEFVNSYYEIDGNNILDADEVERVLNPKMANMGRKILAQPLQNPLGWAWLVRTAQSLGIEDPRKVTHLGQVGMDRAQQMAGLRESTYSISLDDLLESALSEATFKESLKTILAGLEKKGWDVQTKNSSTLRPLKVPHATWQNEVRLFFKAQSIYMAMGNLSMSNAHSLESDYRGMTADDVIKSLGRMHKSLAYLSESDDYYTLLDKMGDNEEAAEKAYFTAIAKAVSKRLKARLGRVSHNRQAGTLQAELRSTSDAYRLYTDGDADGQFLKLDRRGAPRTLVTDFGAGAVGASADQMAARLLTGMDEAAPPDAPMERFIKKIKSGRSAEAKAFRARYGDDWKSVLYGTAWNVHKQRDESELAEDLYDRLDPTPFDTPEQAKRKAELRAQRDAAAKAASQKAVGPMKALASKLDKEEKAVVQVIIGYIPKARREYARRDFGIANYDEVVERLKTKGVLNARGALKPEYAKMLKALSLADRRSVFESLDEATSLVASIASVLSDKPLTLEQIAKALGIPATGVSKQGYSMSDLKDQLDGMTRAHLHAKGKRAKKVGGGYIAEGVESLDEAMSLTKSDRQVIGDFLDKKAGDSKNLTSTGKRLDGNWTGGRGIATWTPDGKIVFEDLGSKAAQTVQRAIRKVAPKNWILESEDESPPRWRPPQDFFSQPAEEIAAGLKEASNSQSEAMSRLDRAGLGSTRESRARLDYAAELLPTLYVEDEDGLDEVLDFSSAYPGLQMMESPAHWYCEVEVPAKDGGTVELYWEARKQESVMTGASNWEVSFFIDRNTYNENLVAEPQRVLATVAALTRYFVSKAQPEAFFVRGKAKTKLFRALKRLLARAKKNLYVLGGETRAAGEDYATFIRKDIADQMGESVDEAQGPTAGRQLDYIVNRRNEVTIFDQRTKKEVKLIGDEGKALANELESAESQRAVAEILSQYRAILESDETLEEGKTKEFILQGVEAGAPNFRYLMGGESDQSCGNCAHYKAENESLGRCAKFGHQCLASTTCDVWTKASTEEEVNIAAELLGRRIVFNESLATVGMGPAGNALLTYTDGHSEEVRWGDLSTYLQNQIVEQPASPSPAPAVPRPRAVRTVSSGSRQPSPIGFAGVPTEYGSAGFTDPNAWYGSELGGGVVTSPDVTFNPVLRKPFGDGGRDGYQGPWRSEDGVEYDKYGQPKPKEKEGKTTINISGGEVSITINESEVNLAAGALRHMREHGRQNSASLAQALGVDAAEVEPVLRRMEAEELVLGLGGGFYNLPEREPSGERTNPLEVEHDKLREGESVRDQLRTMSPKQLRALMQKLYGSLKKGHKVKPPKEVAAVLDADPSKVISLATMSKEQLAALADHLREEASDEMTVTSFTKDDAPDFMRVAQALGISEDVELTERDGRFFCELPSHLAFTLEEEPQACEA